MASDRMPYPVLGSTDPLASESRVQGLRVRLRLVDRASLVEDLRFFVTADMTGSGDDCCDEELVLGSGPELTELGL